MSAITGLVLARAGFLGTKRLTALLMSTWFLLSSVSLALANDVSPESVHAGDAASAGNTSRIANRTMAAGTRGGRFDLDLSSTNSNIILGSRLFRRAESITIDVGGVDQTFRAGQAVTAAQLVAIKQVMSGGQQSLSVNSQGAAIGGNFSLKGMFNSRINDLVVPENVSALSGARSLARLSGDVTNYGSIYLVSGNRGQSGLVSADDITNSIGGLITTDLSSSAFASLNGAQRALDLTVLAVNDITNLGAITSSGSLTLATARGSIFNIATAGASTPLVRAAGDVNLLPGSGTLVNSGLVSSLAGNINIASTNPANNININALGGTFAAILGDINVRNQSYAGAGNIDLTGGDYLSKNLNLYSGTGSINGDVDQVTGNLNSYAGFAHIFADTATLRLGNNCINGDPLFVNTGGDIQITGVVDVTATNEPLAIVASGNIFTTAADTTAQLVNHGGDITLLAGVNITSYGGTQQSPSIPPTSPAANGALFIADVSASSSSGGSIDLSNSTQTTVIDSSSTSGNGGTVTLLALSNGVTGGRVLMPANSVSINTSSTTGEGGNVMVMANSGAGGTVIQLGSVLTGGNSNVFMGKGDVEIYAQNPVDSFLGFDATGAVNASGVFGGIIASSGTGPAGANIVTGDIVTAGVGGTPTAVGPSGAGGNAGSINVQTAGSVTVNGSLLAYGGGGAGGSGIPSVTDINGGGDGGDGNSIYVSAGTSILVSGDVNSSGGGGGGGGADNLGGAPGGQGGGTAPITLLAAGGDLTVGGSVMAAPGSAGGAGGTFVAGVGGGGGGGGGSLGGGGGGGAGMSQPTSGVGG